MSTIQSTLKLVMLLTSTSYLQYYGVIPKFIKESDYGMSVDREVYRGISQSDFGVGVDKYFGELYKFDKDLTKAIENELLSLSVEDIIKCVSKMRYIDTRCRDLCSEENFIYNRDWCLTNCEVRAEDINIPSNCLRYIYNFIKTKTYLNGGDISVVEQAEPYIQKLPTVRSGEVMDPEHHNAIVDAINALSSLLTGLPTGVANPCGYSLYDFLKNICSKGDDFACKWLTLTAYTPVGVPTYYSTDFITDNIISLHFYDAVGYRSFVSDVYISPYRASNSVGYIDIDDLVLEYEKFGGGGEEYSSVLAYAYKYGEFGGVGAVISVRNKYFGNLSRNAPIMKIIYGWNGYLTIYLTPDKKIYIEYPNGSMTIDYDIIDKWLFIVTDFDGQYINLYDEELNNLVSLDYGSLSGVGIYDYWRELYLYKGYYNPSYGSATFQYDWMIVEANTITTYTPVM